MTGHPPEFRAAMLAEAALAQDAGATAAVRARKLAEAATTAAKVVDRPGDAPSPDELRQWALRRAMERGVVLRPDGQPRANFVLRMPDGSAVVTRQTASPRTIVITPENADELGRRFEAERREQENALLIATYGEDVLREEGLIP